MIREFKLNSGKLNNDKLGPYTELYWHSEAGSQFVRKRHGRILKRR